MVGETVTLLNVWNMPFGDVTSFFVLTLFILRHQINVGPDP